MARERSIGRQWRGGLMLLALVGCGRSTPPGMLVGESEHFRLYVDPEATIPPGLEGSNALVALETEWADVHSMLQMPDGKITYYWLSPGHIAAACGETDEGACIWERGLEIDSATLPNPHELNHAYVYLRKQREPVPFLAEGIAEAIACGPDLPMYVTDAPWQGVVGQLDSSNDVYEQGGIFVRYLIRTYGIDAFLRYYEQSPEQRDPALFAANFQSFWNLPLDDVWTAIHTVPPGALSVAETKICPCSLPPLDASGAVTSDPARAPYWPLPNTGHQTLALGAAAHERVWVRDCAGIRQPVIGEAVLARLDGAEPRYVLPPLETATVDSYLADDCLSAAPYSLSPVMSGTGYLVAALPNPASSVTFYLDLVASFSGVLHSGLDEICGTCGFDQGSCQAVAAGTMPTVQGPLYGKATLRGSTIHPVPDVVLGYLDIRSP